MQSTSKTLTQARLPTIIALAPLTTAVLHLLRAMARTHDNRRAATALTLLLLFAAISAVRTALVNGPCEVLIASGATHDMV